MTDIDRMNRALDTGRETGKITQQQFEDAFNSQVIPGDGGQTILGLNKLPISKILGIVDLLPIFLSIKFLRASCLILVEVLNLFGPIKGFFV